MGGLPFNVKKVDKITVYSFLFLFHFGAQCLVSYYVLSSELETEISDIFFVTVTYYAGAAEKVKQVKQLLHRNSEVLLQRNF